MIQRSVEIHDSLVARKDKKDNALIFVTQDGEPCDDGSHLLAKNNKVPAIKKCDL